MQRDPEARRLYLRNEAQGFRVRLEVLHHVSALRKVNVPGDFPVPYTLFLQQTSDGLDLRQEAREDHQFSSLCQDVIVQNILQRVELTRSDLRHPVGFVCPQEASGDLLQAQQLGQNRRCLDALLRRKLRHREHPHFVIMLPFLPAERHLPNQEGLLRQIQSLRLGHAVGDGIEPRGKLLLVFGADHLLAAEASEGAISTSEAVKIVSEHRLVQEPELRPEVLRILLNRSSCQRKAKGSAVCNGMQGKALLRLWILDPLAFVADHKLRCKAEQRLKYTVPECRLIVYGGNPQHRFSAKAVHILLLQCRKGLQPFFLLAKQCGKPVREGSELCQLILPNADDASRSNDQHPADEAPAKQSSHDRKGGQALPAAHFIQTGDRSLFLFSFRSPPFPLQFSSEASCVPGAVALEGFQFCCQRGFR